MHRLGSIPPARSGLNAPLPAHQRYKQATLRSHDKESHQTGCYTTRGSDMPTTLSPRATGHIITTPPPGSTYARLHGPRCTTSPHPHCYQCELSGEAAMTLGNWMGNDYLERLLRSGWESNLSTRAVPIQNTRSHRRKTDAGLGAAAGLVDGQAPSPEHSRRAPTNMRHSQTTSRAHSEAHSIAELLVDDPAQLLPPTKPQLNNPHLDDIEAAKPAGHDGASEPKHARNDTSSEPGREEAPATPTA